MSQEFEIAYLDKGVIKRIKHSTKEMYEAHKRNLSDLGIQIVETKEPSLNEGMKVLSE